MNSREINPTVGDSLSPFNATTNFLLEFRQAIILKLTIQ